MESQKNLPAITDSGPKTLAPDDLVVLRKARASMENIGWAMEGLNNLGNVLEKQVAHLTPAQQERLKQISYGVLKQVVGANLATMKTEKKKPPSSGMFQTLATLSGAIGGAFGFTAFAADLALTTKLMMRSIMDIARSEGEDLQELDTQLACLQVFALGGKSKHDDSLDTSYFALRVAIRSSVKGATQPLMKAVSLVAARYSVQAAEKFAVQAVPIVGAAGGAVINMAFITHFQNMAKAHFAIRRLERKYSPELVEAAFLKLGV